MSRARASWLGALALLFAAANAAARVTEGRPEQVVWACQWGAALAGAGLLARSPRLLAAGTLWLSAGLPMWVYYMADGGVLRATSVLVHVGALGIGVAGVRGLGMARGIWVWATFLLAVPFLLARLLTPPAANVNLAFRAWPGWEGYFPSHAAYLASVAALLAGFFLAAEAALRWACPGPGGDPPRPAGDHGCATSSSTG